MDLSLIQALIDSLHILTPNAPQYDCGSLCILFSDGEIVMTKAGDLWLQRTQHVECCGTKENCRIEGIKWPSKVGGHDCMVFEFEFLERMKTLRDLLWTKVDMETAWKNGSIRLLGVSYVEYLSRQVAR
jgi:hypothetical protein